MSIDGGEWKAGSEVSKSKLPGWLRPFGIHKVIALFTEFDEHLASDQAYADHVGRGLDMWTAAGSFTIYTLAAILLFIIN